MADFESDIWQASGTAHDAWTTRRCEERLATCERAWRESSLGLIVVDAVEICASYGRPPPRWVIEAVASLADAGMTQSEKNRRQQDTIDLMRWEAVKELRERRKELYHQMGDDRGHTWDNAYAAVSEMLERTPAACGEDAVKTSYKYVEREMREGRGARFYIADPRLDSTSALQALVTKKGGPSLG